MRLPFCLTTLCLLLAACGLFNPDPGRYDGFEIALTVEVDKTQASAGDAVTVTLTGGFGLPAQSRLTENVYEDLKLGACVFFNEVAEEAKGGLCRDENLPLPDELQLLAGMRHLEEYGTFVVPRGKARFFEHTFTFTSSVPGEFFIEPVRQFQGQNPSRVNYAGGSPVRVIFR